MGWEIGTNPAYLYELVGYWADHFDWPARERELERVPRYRIELEPGVTISFQHIRANPDSESPSPLPLVLTHGWPDSSWRYSKVIDLLTDPGALGGDPLDSFDLVIPDIPGFGHSSLAPGVDINAVDVARLWAKLMNVLGYERYGVAGGDIGSAVSRFLALDHPDHVVGVHRMDAGLPIYQGDPCELTTAERDWLTQAQRWAQTEGAYAAMHRTRPLTAAVGLSDSPAGLAAWVVEKLYGWAHVDSSLDDVFGKDDVLTLLTPMWLNGTIAQSMRMYRANSSISPDQHARTVNVPSGFAIFTHDVLPAPEAWLRRFNNVTRATLIDQGGHFAPYERPETYANELTEFFRPIRAAL